MEVQGDRQNNDNPSVQHKCQVSVAVRSRSMANQQDNTEKCPDICKAVLAEIFRNIWMDQVSNEAIWERTNQVQIQMEILMIRRGWLDHTLRKPNSNITKQAGVKPSGQDKGGGGERSPKNTT